MPAPQWPPFCVIRSRHPAVPKDESETNVGGKFNVAHQSFVEPFQAFRLLFKGGFLADTTHRFRALVSFRHCGRWQAQLRQEPPWAPQHIRVFQPDPRGCPCAPSSKSTIEFRNAISLKTPAAVGRKRIPSFSSR
ncbi:uncharacterized protein VTP21DRAFT_5237 [Calcarisporiella thermophila]|uniref:uncharacterized protein n=1 Tax=Calcarisporiella thermophila TaxID=911321 RepID=UPI003742599E